MLLSVVIPCREHDVTLSRCLRSLACTGHDGDIEVVVVVDGDDKSHAETTLRDSLPVKIQSSVMTTGGRQGAAAARNRGIEAAKGRFLWFVDSDDEVDAQVLALLWNDLATLPDNAALLHLGPMREGRDDKYKPWQRLPERKAVGAVMLPRSHCLDHTTYWISRAFLEENATLRYQQDMAILEDSLFVLSLLAHCDSVVCAYNCRPYIHNVEPRSLTSGVWRRDRAALFMPSVETFFASFGKMINDKAFHCENQGHDDNIKALYHRSRYVYMRVLAVKGVKWSLYEPFFYRHLVDEGFQPRNLKERLVFNVLFHRTLSLLCRVFRH